MVEDPAATVVQCVNSIFLAIVQVKAIQQRNNNITLILLSHIHEPNVKIQVQIMKIALWDMSQQPEGPDWEWIGTFENQVNFCDTESWWFEVIDPVLLLASRGRNASNKKYTFWTSELCGLAMLLHEHLCEDILKLPLVSVSDTFPY